MAAVLVTAIGNVSGKVDDFGFRFFESKEFHLRLHVCVVMEACVCVFVCGSVRMCCCLCVACCLVEVRAWPIRYNIPY